MSDFDLLKVQYEWLYDMIKRIKNEIEDPNSTDEQKIDAIKWLVKQGLKVDRED